MHYIHLTNGIKLKDKGTPRHIHAIMGLSPEGYLVEQSKDHDQLIQRCIFPDGRVELTTFQVGKTLNHLVLVDSKTLQLYPEEVTNGDKK